MAVKRFFRILKANLTSGYPERDKVEENTGYKEPASESKSSNIKNPMDIREAEYYANLELKPGADFTLIKVAYKRLMKQYHPDLHIANEEKRKAAEIITTRLNEAYKYFEVKFNKS